MILHLNDTTPYALASQLVGVACGFRRRMDVTTRVSSEVTCIKCRGTVRFRIYKGKGN